MIVARKDHVFIFLRFAWQDPYHICQLRLFDLLVHPNRVMHRVNGRKDKHQTTSGLELLASKICQPGKILSETGIHQYEVALAVLGDIFKSLRHEGGACLNKDFSYPLCSVTARCVSEEKAAIVPAGSGLPSKFPLADKVFAWIREKGWR